MAIIGKYTVMILIAVFLTWYDSYLNSDYLVEFFKDNAILLVVTIFTIHTAAVGILLSQLQIIKQATGKSLKKTIISIRKSFIEIFIIIFLIVFLVIALNAALQTDKSLNSIILNIPNIKYILTALISIAIIDMIYVIYDTNNAMLMTLEFLNEE